jgi:hypothetical protein
VEPTAVGEPAPSKKTLKEIREAREREARELREAL